MSVFANRRCPPTPGIASLLLVGLLLASGAALAQQDPQPTDHEDRIDVTRVLIDARVLDSEGNAVGDLDLTQFRVRIGGRRAIVESAEWIEPNGLVERPIRDVAADVKRIRETSEVVEAPREPGRLLVFFFQRDIIQSRMVGLMKMVKRAEEVLDTLDPNDQIAVLCYDSHLRLYTDFTKDREKVRQILKNSIVTYEDPPPITKQPAPSIAEHFDPVAAKGAPNPERALWVIGQSLREIPGNKAMFFFGWGLGRIVGGSFVQLRAEYSTALLSLTEARVTVFSLDVTRADYHTLEGPLRTVALDTGGFYVKTHLFSEVAIERVVRAIEGYYVLTVRKPENIDTGKHTLKVSLRGIPGVVHARRWVVF